MTLAPLRDFITAATREMAHDRPEAERLAILGGHLATLVASDDWLPDELAQPHPEFYRQYLLHADPLERFSVVSFVWGPGQRTPVHDHRVWGLIGMLRGEETAQPYGFDGAGRLQAQGAAVTLKPGEVAAVSPRLGDVHQVANAFADRSSISIHVYGANIGAVQRGGMRPTAAASPSSRATRMPGCPICGTAPRKPFDAHALAADQPRGGA